MKENSFLRDFSVIIDSNNKLRASGNYADIINSYSSVGGINFSIDLNQIVEPEYQMYQFPINTLIDYETPSYVKKVTAMVEKGKSPGFEYLSVIDILSNENGYYSIMRKEWRIINPNTKQTNYISQDYIISSFSNDDELLWVKKVPIELHTNLENFFKEKVILINDNLYLIHFDAEYNFTNFEDVKLGKRKAIPDYIVIHKLDLEGELSQELILKISDIGLSEFPFQYLTGNNDEATFLFFTKDSASFVNIDIKE